MARWLLLSRDERSSPMTQNRNDSDKQKWLERIVRALDELKEDVHTSRVEPRSFGGALMDRPSARSHE
jgi:hypothetical protein